MTEENGVDTELLGQSAFHKLTHGFSIRDRLRDVLAEQQAIERQYRRHDNSDEYTSRTAWAEWVLESDLDYTEAALLLGISFTTCAPRWITPCGRSPRCTFKRKRPTEVAFGLRSTEQSYTKWARLAVTGTGRRCSRCSRAASRSTPWAPARCIRCTSCSSCRTPTSISCSTSWPTPRSTWAVSLLIRSHPAAWSPPSTKVSSARDRSWPGGFARPTQPGKTEVTLKPVFAFERVFRYVDQDGAQQWLVVGDALNEIGPDVVEAVTYLLSAHKRDHENR